MMDKALENNIIGMKQAEMHFHFLVWAKFFFQKVCQSFEPYPMLLLLVALKIHMLSRSQSRRNEIYKLSETYLGKLMVNWNFVKARVTGLICASPALPEFALS